MDLILNLLILVLGFGLGAMFYRYTMKRDPEKLERWAAEIKAAKQRARDRMTG